MYKWHVHSAIGRGRPLVGDFARVADGISASLRLFSISAARAADDGGTAAVSRPSRAERSARAVAEISSLAPGGIDARSLAAKPPPAFTIRRVDDSTISSPQFQGQGFGARSGRGGQSAMGPMRGTGPWGASRGGPRSGFRGRGRGGQRGGRGGRGGTGKRNKMRRDNDTLASNLMNGEPLTAEEQAYVDSVEMGVPSPATVGTTSREVLEKEAPAIAASKAPIGMVGTIRDHLRVLAGQHGNEYLSSEQHALRYREGKGTFFVDEKDKAQATGPGRYGGAPEEYDTLSEEERQTILQTLVKGQYRPIKEMAKGDTLSAIDTYAQKNETYLPRDAAVLKARVQTLLPSKTAAKPSKPAPQPKKAVA